MDLESEVQTLLKKCDDYVDQISELLHENVYLGEVIDHHMRDAVDAANALELSISVMEFDLPDIPSPERRSRVRAQIEGMNAALKKIYKITEGKDDPDPE